MKLQLYSNGQPISGGLPYGTYGPYNQNGVGVFGGPLAPGYTINQGIG